MEYHTADHSPEALEMAVIDVFSQGKAVRCCVSLEDNYYFLCYTLLVSSPAADRNANIGAAAMDVEKLDAIHAEHATELDRVSCLLGRHLKTAC